MNTLANIQLSDVERAVNDFIAAVRAPNYFANTRRGELTELRADLNSDERIRRKETVKRVIAQMTIGKDVSSLFPDMLKNMQTDDLELKKLVYLYLMNYAKTQPELVILAVNTFVKDTSDRNPLIRALAIRTMGCIRVDKMLDFISEPLMKCLRDDNPYVRKTAAINVAKLYDLSPELAVDNGFIDVLRELVADSNPMVVANAVTALMDINEASGTGGLFTVDSGMISKLLIALNECTEWGQIAVLTAIVNYTPRDSEDATNICERVVPRLQHANGSILLVYMPFIEDAEFRAQILKKMTPPLVTLLSSAPEIQYVALRNISLILQKQPNLLGNEMRVFSVEYANEVDIDFVRRSVRAIGRCAVKVEGAAERCIDLIIVIKDIFRKYPHQYEGVISVLCDNLDILDEPEAKASLIWIIGEYADRIENAAPLLGQFLENFKEEKPCDGQDIVIQTLEAATKECDNPDIRDRAYIYWRLLSSNPDAAKYHHPYSRCYCNLSTLAAVYHKLPESIVDAGHFIADSSLSTVNVAAVAAQATPSLMDLLDGPSMGALVPTGNNALVVPATSSQGNASTSSGGGAMNDLFDLFGSGNTSTTPVLPTSNNSNMSGTSNQAKSNHDPFADLLG
ncbi:armadillo-type protein [Syncephalis plumigaleata]|nr:armadillo-type protein [Syncephalis plumigaleata]